MSEDEMDPKAPTRPDEAKDDRRKFLVATCGALSAGVAATVAAPALGYLAFPVTHQVVTGGGDFITAGPAKNFRADLPVRVELFADQVDAWNRVRNVKLGAAWVRRDAGKLVALSSVCPHLGCAIDLTSDGQRFVCPCHDSFFKLDGAVEEGPSPRAMDPLDIRESDGLVQIRFERFKLGKKERLPL